MGRRRGQGALQFLNATAIASRAEEDAEFEGHVEPGQAVLRVEFGAGEVVDAISALVDQAIELLDARFPCVVGLSRGPGHEAAGIDGEDQGAEGSTYALSNGS
jgi:hypothetical protein